MDERIHTKLIFEQQWGCGAPESVMITKGHAHADATELQQMFHRLMLGLGFQYDKMSKTFLDRFPETKDTADGMSRNG